MRRAALRLVVGAAAVVALSFSISTTGLHVAAAPRLPYAYPNGVPTAGTANNLDCNGWSPTYATVKVNMKMLCTDPIQRRNGVSYPFYDNGHYVGHDEPVTKFISSSANSGNTFTFFQQLSKDPAGTPTTNPNLAANSSVSHYAELSVAPWFGLPICDPLSDPSSDGTPAPCTPDSDSNNPNTAGSAFMELQFYPPGYGPFPDSTSCDQTRWCSALNIDSLTCLGGCATQNPNCVEPVNFAFLTKDGIPTGPPNPQNANINTFTTNSDTLFMNQGDTLKVSIFEVPDNGTGAANTGGLETKIDDITTGQSGFMIASASRGFMNTNPVATTTPPAPACGGTPFSFHAEYATAKQPNIVPWAALEGGVLMQDEIGHGEVCGGTGSTKLTNADAVSSTGFSDPTVFDSCNDATSDPQPTRTPPPTNTGGECQAGTMAACTFPTTEDAAGTNTFGGGTLTGGCTAIDHCELADGFCLPQGPRTVVINGNNTTWNDAVAFCDTGRFQNGDLDYDGTTYQTLYPDGNAGHPTTFKYIGPFDASGTSYPSVQLETDAAGSEQDCNTGSGANCTIPPYGAKFYPFWSLSNVPIPGISVSANNYCVWNFGGDGNPGELDNFGGITAPQNGSTLSQYGSPGAHFAGTLITSAFPNPQVNSQTSALTHQPYSCPAFTLSQVTITPGTGIPELPWVPAAVVGGLALVGIAGHRRQKKARLT